MTPLRQRMLEDMQLSGLAPKTQQAYIRAVRQLAQHYGKSPDQITEEELRQYFLFLYTEKHVAPPRQVKTARRLVVPIRQHSTTPRARLGLDRRGKLASAARTTKEGLDKKHSILRQVCRLMSSSLSILQSQ
jgi:Phage integrase, N-terminal SAM-like domain